MTDLDSPRKNNDCYFYYYSKCAKGDNCTFRHEPSALGCETTCSFWKEGKCLNVHCNFRHMELRKNRKEIPCYWETQPGGCLKEHCPFLHQNPRPNATDESIDSKNDSGTESADNTINEKSFKSPPVDSLVVNFEEESDNESAPTHSPIKTSRSVKVKTLEEIKLEKIQAESAAYYSYEEFEAAQKQQQQQPLPQSDGDDLRKRILERLSSKSQSAAPLQTTTGKKRAIELAPLIHAKKQKRELKQDVSGIKIKTLEEIRAERARKQDNNAICDSLVTSSTTENVENVQKPKKIKLLRQVPVLVQENAENEQKMAVDAESSKVENDDDKLDDLDDEMTTTTTAESLNDTAPSNNKTLDEVLLLQDDDDNVNVSLKEEERLLNDIDDLLGD